ncbi:hypothetical protein OS965_40210 [Streptomyces sp. H27-G5]|uniref:hypothetical protein n=1 Tax=Streptomyces sp. H27-G5 TaxID=2996698 RepID=UPI00226ECEAD|nr:hypothetical protein [Streptomyces sp. H27-G5]MCY0924258.1 hypothetical protein [Streptomyces sp. H27-G5]
MKNLKDVAPHVTPEQRRANLAYRNLGKAMQSAKLPAWVLQENPLVPHTYDVHGLTVEDLERLAFHLIHGSTP